MAVETAADRAMLLSDFGVSAGYSQNEGPEVSITGIFDRQHLAIDAGDGGVAGFAVAFTCRADDTSQLTFGKACQDDRLRIEGEYWRVLDVQQDGTGMVTLILRKA